MMYTIWGKKTDVLYCPHISLLPIAVVISLLKNSALIYDAQEIYLEDYANREAHLSRIVSWISTKIEASLLRFADGILTIDTANDLLYERYSGHTQNIDVIYNVPDIAPEEISAEAINNRSKETVRIIYVGLINNSKGVVKLTEAFSDVASGQNVVELVLVGPSFDEAREEIADIVLRDNLEDQVTLTGNVSSEQMYSYLLNADVAVAPYQPTAKFVVSRKNARKVFDYMNAGLPIIGPDFGGVSEFIEVEDSGITVDTTEPVAIAKGIARLISNPKKASEFGRNGRSKIREEYNWTTEREKLLTVIENAI